MIQRQFVYKRHRIDSKTYKGESEQMEEKEHVNSKEHVNHKEAEVKNMSEKIDFKTNKKLLLEIDILYL